MNAVWVKPPPILVSSKGRTGSSIPQRQGFSDRKVEGYFDKFRCTAKFNDENVNTPVYPFYHGFSKKIENLEAAVSPRFICYHFSRIHETLRVITGKDAIPFPYNPSNRFLTEYFQIRGALS
jgi:hypothetical protein